MFKSKTIQSKLFLSYSLLIIVVILVFATSFYVYISKILENKASESLYQVSSHITAEFDSQLQLMNSTSEKLLFSKPLNRLFFSDMFQLNKSTIDQQRQFNEILYSIIGLNKEFSQINMFRSSGEFASIGDNSVFSIISPEQIAKIQWVHTAFMKNGKKLISLHKQDAWNLKTPTVISLSRAFSPSWGENETSILEIQQDYHVFSNMIKSALVKPDSQTRQEITVYVFNKNGELIYPMETTQTAQLYWESVLTHANTSNFIIKNANTQSEDMISYTYSDFSEWTVIASESKNLLLKPVTAFRNVILVFGLIAILITLLISYIVSQTLTTPIKKIHRSIRSLSLTTLSPKLSTPIESHSHLNELEQLNYSFQDMRLRLQESLDEAISSRSHELEARMFALQAQMNPHFLYNTITNVSVMAEESGQQSIVDVCESLSVMLRYISSEHAAPVKLCEELEHTNSYLNLMKLRYEDDIIVHMDVSDSLLDLDVPKLMLQPIVENCMKYGIHIDPPWIITIIGRQVSGGWELTIRDNGKGFNADEIVHLQEQFAKTDPLVRIPNLKINGMGLLNIYARLTLLFGDALIFTLSNHPEGGAVVTICIKH
ncbi:histidine kinase [Paenibacillus alba]|uniref:sensor histidine kinase n=1 Tax=Paenibacillus alba TaxID=1197127 RepID=UPI0015656035|nr:histidine kinase [Paenibacillus alba]NQX66492.1 histidine kinase [Paenibacillus alba]